MVYIVHTEGGEDMKLSEGVRTALSAAGMNQADLTSVFGVSPQAIANKQSRGTWTAAELMKIASAVGGQLAIDFPDGSKVVLSEADQE